MALRLRSNGAPLSGALFVSNPRSNRKTRRKKTRKRATRKNRTASSRRRSSKKRRNVAAKRRKSASLRKLQNRRNASKKRVSAKRRNAAKKAAATRKRNAAKRKAAAKKAAATRKRNASKKRRNASSSYKRKTTKRKNRRNSAKRKSYSLAKRKSRRNTSAMAVWGNRVSSGLNKFVGKIPVIGSTAKKFLAPLTIGAGAAALHYGAVAGLQRYAPGVAARIAPVQFTVTGSIVAAVLGMGGKIPVLKKLSAKTRNQLSAGALILGAGLDTYRMLTRRAGDLGAEVSLYDYGDEVALYDYSGLGVDLGDGGAYDVVPLAGLGVDLGSGHGGYAEVAEFGDAYHAPLDFTVQEGEAMLAGPGAYMAAFGPCPVIRSRSGGLVSPIAGRPGHRWGWLIKLVGWDKAQQIAALPPAQRTQVIANMKSQALSVLDEQKVAQEEGNLSGLGLDLGGVIYTGSAI